MVDRKHILTVMAWLLVPLISGCGGMAKGITEALLEKSEKEDLRACEITGPSSEGLLAQLRSQEDRPTDGLKKKDQTMKVLMVHGIGPHLPGYSAPLTAKLMRALGLEIREERHKEFILRKPKLGDGPLGTVRVSRFMNQEQTRELLFYELTWSKIAEQEKKVLDYDASQEQDFRRAGVNSIMKHFVNSHIPDTLIYLGPNQVKIRTSVRQALCWMTSGDWDDYEPFTDKTCDLRSNERIKEIVNDDYVIIGHSLGSRIAMDTLQWAVELMDNQESSVGKRAFQKKDFTIYMLANQLPLMELGQEPVKTRGQIPSYCQADGAKYADRGLNKLSIVAFSDPNDILSYTVPPTFADNYLNSRLCPKVTNVVLNIAFPISLLGITDFADPVTAHSGYDRDDRVIGIMTHGVGHEDVAPIVAERCVLSKTVNNARINHGS